MPFPTLLRRLRKPTAEEVAALRSYRAHLGPAIERLFVIRKQWLEFSLLERDDTRLANTVAVYRWELARLSQQVDAIEPPELAASSHRELQGLFADASRGCQLLATGHRFHKSETVCDGQVLLVEAADQAERITRALDALAVE